MVTPATGAGTSAVVTEVPASAEEEQENVSQDDAYLELEDPNESTIVVRESGEEVVAEQPKKGKRKRLVKQSDIMPAGSHLPDREQFVSDSVTPFPKESEGFLDSFTEVNLRVRGPKDSSTALDAPVFATVATTTVTRDAAVLTSLVKSVTDADPDLAGPSRLETSEGSDDSFYDYLNLDSPEKKRRYVPKWNITNDSLLDDAFSCRTLFNVAAALQVCLEAEVRLRVEHELELKEKLRARYVARGKLLKEKDSEILRLKSLLAKKEV
ncbi:hypothetical protein Tco_0765085 [Tanacetum coccineum]